MTKAWYEATVFDHDDEIIVDCLVDTYAERDPYGTGDSPTQYMIDVVKVTHDGNDYEWTDQQEEDIIEQVMEYLAEDARP